VPRRVWSWLTDRASLTARLEAACGDRFRVELQRQYWGRPTLDEARVLGLHPERFALLREVCLYCGEVPWVFARTVIPRRSLSGRLKALGRLGTRPLGAVLFADPRMRRGPLEIAAIRPGTPLFERATARLDDAPPQIWGRRSVFRLAGKPLLVSEIFLPAFGESRP